MAQTIKLKRSAIAGAIPTTAQLDLGEVAINTFDGKMYIKRNINSSESIVEIGGGVSTAIWKQYSYTAEASQTVFTGPDNNAATLNYLVGYIEVYLNGVLLDPAVDFTATNSTSVVLTVAAAVNDLLQIDTFAKAIGIGDILLNSFTGDNSTVAFTLSIDPGYENNTSVFINGVYQNKTTYTLAGTTLTFSTAPASAAQIEVVIGSRNVSLSDIEDLSIAGNLTVAGTDGITIGDTATLTYSAGTDAFIFNKNITVQGLIQGNSSLDGGSAASIYLAVQSLNGGNA